MQADQSTLADNVSRARSFLFVPGDRPERFSKALSSGADIVVIDLEDAVAGPNKGGARDNVRAFEAGTSLDRVIVRINATTTDHFELDLEACIAGGVRGVMLAKTECREDLNRVARQANDMRVVALVESARGLDHCATIAGHDSVVRLAFGSIDFRLDLGIPEDGVGLAAARSELVLRSRLASIAGPIEGVTTSWKDGNQLLSDIATARAFGFAAKLAIHPAQVEAINFGFAPSEAEVKWAKRILSAVQDAGGVVGAVALDGEMIDRPVILRAEGILERAGEAL